MWGVGATVGPYVMGYILSGGRSWNTGYRIIGIVQVFLTVLLFFSLPMWILRSDKESKDGVKPKLLREVVKIPGVKEVMVTFFCYCALEQTVGLWASSYFVLNRNIDKETAAWFASLFFIGITIGRAINGFLTIKFNDTWLIRIGQGIILVGIFLVMLPFNEVICLIGIVLVGLGCAPIYPCIIHSTPDNFGEENSQAVIGVQMASAYVGNIVMPPVFGIIAEYIFIGSLPIYIFVILIIMFLMHTKMLRITKKRRNIN